MEGCKLPKDSYCLCKMFSANFNKWWNEELFDWLTCSGTLAKYCTKYISSWWNPERFNWEDSWILAQHCSEYFTTWWNSDKYNWGDSWALATYCSDSFSTWWDPDKFDWSDSITLLDHCSEHIRKWWIPGKLKWSVLRGTVSSVDFDDSNFEIDVLVLKTLVEKCKEHTDIWLPEALKNNSVLKMISKIARIEPLETRNQLDKKIRDLQ